MNNRPRIGITKSRRGGDFAFVLHWLSIRTAGGYPVKVTPENAGRVGRVDGLLVGGGKDVFPAHFQDTPEPKAGYGYDHRLDTMELNWLRKAASEDIPVLGICRGAQLMNIAAGGSLHLDVSAAFENADYPDGWLNHVIYRKRVKVRPGTLLHRILGRSVLHVNSLHRQSIGEVAPGFIVSAEEDNGVIQTIEKADHPFCLGVQFHPELLLHQRPFRNLFRAFVQAAQQQRGGRDRRAGGCGG